VPIRQRFDRVLLGAAVLQVAVGLALLASASWVVAQERYGLPESYFFTWQAAAAVVGLGVLVVCMHLKSELLIEPRLARFGLGVCWLLLAAAFAMPEVANTHRWLSVGGISVQPSVLARLAITVFAAVELTAAAREGWTWKRPAALGAVSFLTAGLIIAEPDLGSAALLLIIVAAIAFVAGMPLRMFAAPAAASVVALVAAILSSPYRMERVRAFLDPAAATAAAWQSTQSLIALGSGGLVGRGYGAGLQKLFFLPEPHTDFIFAITGEELGLVGVLLLIGLASVIVWRGLRVAFRLQSPGRSLLAFGIAIGFAVQTLIHMVVCLAMLPPKGIPLPLVSYGKTDLVVSLMAVGLLLNLSREVAS
jgi:cell division protein FtsW